MNTIENNIDIFSSISTDGNQVLIEVEQDKEVIARKLMSADELSSYIMALGKLRAQMAQKVNRRLEQNPVFTDVTREAIFHVNRQHAVGKEFFIAARHEGFGWLAFTMQAEPGMVLATMIVKQIEAMQGKVIKPKGGLIV